MSLCLLFTTFSSHSEDMEVTEEEQQQVEEQVERLLRGEGSEVIICDVGLEQSKPATLRKNVTYIVCAVIFNDKVPGSGQSFIFELVDSQGYVFQCFLQVELYFFIKFIYLSLTVIWCCGL